VNVVTNIILLLNIMLLIL